MAWADLPIGGGGGGGGEPDCRVAQVTHDEVEEGIFTSWLCHMVLEVIYHRGPPVFFPAGVVLLLPSQAVLCALKMASDDQVLCILPGNVNGLVQVLLPYRYRKRPWAVGSTQDNFAAKSYVDTKPYNFLIKGWNSLQFLES